MPNAKFSGITGVRGRQQPNETMTKRATHCKKTVIRPGTLWVPLQWMFGAVQLKDSLAFGEVSNNSPVAIF